LSQPDKTTDRQTDSMASDAGSSHQCEQPSLGKCSSPARTCSCDVYAICRQEFQKEGKLGYCGIWDPVTGDELWSIERNGIVGCAYSSTANKMAAICHLRNDTDEKIEVGALARIQATIDVAVVVWDLLSGDEMLSVTGNLNCDRFCDFNQDGARLVSWNYHPQGFCVRDVLSGVVLFTLLHQGSWPCFVGDGTGNNIALQIGASIHVWDIDSGSEVHCFHTGLSEESIRRPVPSSDGRLCSVYSHTKFEVWEVSKGKKIFEQTGIAIGGVGFGGNGDLVTVIWEQGVVGQRKLTCWRITDGSVVFDVRTVCEANCMRAYSPLRSAFFFSSSYLSVYEVDSATGVTVARAKIPRMMNLHSSSAMTILL
jgi:WD40 repeat protein